MATKTTTTAKVEAKAATKPEVKAPAKKAETKKVEAKKVEAKKVEAKAEKVEAKKEKVKAEAKTTTKKTTTKTTTKKTSTKVFVQFFGREVDTEAITEAAKADFIAKGGKKTGIKDVQVYIKPEDNAAYYVIEGVEGVISL